MISTLLKSSNTIISIRYMISETMMSKPHLEQWTYRTYSDDHRTYSTSFPNYYSGISAKISSWPQLPSSSQVVTLYWPEISMSTISHIASLFANSHYAWPSDRCLYRFSLITFPREPRNNICLATILPSLFHQTPLPMLLVTPVRSAPAGDLLDSARCR